MQKVSLEALAREHIERAATSASGRSATTVYGGHEHVLRQTLVAMAANTSLSEHQDPCEATVFVLRGRVRLTAGQTSWEARSGDLLMLPPGRHSLHAIENSAVILTVAMPRT